MGKYVQLNDIFDETTPTVLERRVDYAFGTDGTDFWQNFFLCNTSNCDTSNENDEKDKVIYLFTEYQLEFLLDWWNEKFRTCNQNTRLNLEYSRQELLKIDQKNKHIKEILACYIVHKDGYKELGRVGFGWQPSRDSSPGGLKNVDFFDGTFRGEPSNLSKKLDDEKYNKEYIESIKRLLRATMEVIANEFGGPVHKRNISGVIIEYKKWLRYLAQKRDVTLPFEAEYCIDKNPECPLVKEINCVVHPPSTTPPTTTSP